MSRGHFVGINQHRVMLADKTRMEAYRTAIELQVEPGMRVLDLGTGTGILALWAARAGATVIAVEPHDVIEVARRVAVQNGLAERITFLQADSRSVNLEMPVDLVLTECMGNFFITDEMQPVLRDLPRLMGEGAVTIPRRISLHLAGASVPGWRELSFWSHPVDSFDFWPAADFAVQTAYVLDCEPYHIVTTVEKAADFALVEAPDDLFLRVDLEVRTAAPVHVLLGWFEADLGAEVTLTTRPGVRTHWGQMAFPIPVTSMDEGDRIEADLSLRMDAQGRSRFAWSGVIRPAGGPEVRFSRDTGHRFRTRPDGAGG